MSIDQAIRLCKTNNLSLLTDFWRGPFDSLGSPIYYQVKCNTCNTKFRVSFKDKSLKTCPYCSKHEKRSQRERQLQLWLKSKGEVVVCGDRTILEGKEIDIFLPERKIGIELNGVAYHYCKYNKQTTIGRNKDIDYHRNKTIKALSKGVLLYHFWDYESIESVKSFVESLLNLNPPKTNQVDKNPEMVHDSVLVPIYYVSQGSKDYPQGVYYSKPLIWNSSVSVYEIYNSGFIYGNSMQICKGN